jgi:hypothetical protein
MGLKRETYFQRAERSGKTANANRHLTIQSLTKIHQVVSVRPVPSVFSPCSSRNISPSLDAANVHLLVISDKFLHLLPFNKDAQ